MLWEEFNKNLRNVLKTSNYVQFSHNFRGGDRHKTRWKELFANW
jgi:hypothetical protein